MSRLDRRTAECNAGWYSRGAGPIFVGMSAVRRSAAFRLILATVALLAAFAQPTTVLLHGVAHQREAAHTVAVAAVPATDWTGGAQAPSASRSAVLQAPDDHHADHPVLHTQTLATLTWSFSPAVPVVVARALVLATVVRTTVAIGAPPAYPLAPRVLLPDQPRAPPLG